MSRPSRRFQTTYPKLRGRRAELEEEEERESKRTDVQTYSEGTFKGNGFDIDKNSKCEVPGTLTRLQGLWRMPFTHTHTYKWSQNVKERLLTSNIQTACPFPVQDRKQVKETKETKTAQFFMFCWTHQAWAPPLLSVCVCVVQCGSCNFCPVSQFPPHQSPNKTMPVFVQPNIARLLLLCFAGCVCVCVSACGLYHTCTLAHAGWDFTKTVGRYDYKLASVLIRFEAVKGGTFILSR